jgi:hypothetical protein
MKSIKDLMAIKLIPEILALCSACKTQDEVVTLLKLNRSPALCMLLHWAFIPNVIFDVPIPEWKRDPNPIGLSPNNLFIEARRIYLFNSATKLPKRKKTEILLNILESIHPSEADLLIKLLSPDRNLGIKNLNYEVVDKAFPGLLTRD